MWEVDYQVICAVCMSEKDYNFILHNQMILHK